MPRGSSTSPGWFVKVINQVITDLEQVAAYFDDMIVFDSDPTAHVKTMRALFDRLHKHNLKLSPSKARLGTTDADFLGHSISPAGARPNADKVSALIKIPMPQDLRQVRTYMVGVWYYRKFLRYLSKRIRPIISLLRKGVKFEFTSAMEVIVREILAEFWTTPILVFPNWDAVADVSRPFHAYCSVGIDGFGAGLEQEQPDGSVRPIAYISRATLDSERHWAPLDLEAGSIGLSNAFDATSGARFFASIRITRRSKASAKWEATMRESNCFSSFSLHSTTPLSTARTEPTERPISSPVY